MIDALRSEPPSRAVTCNHWQKKRATKSQSHRGVSSAGGAKRRVRTNDPVETSRRSIQSDSLRPDHSSEREPGSRPGHPPNWMVLPSMPLARRCASTPRQTLRASVPPLSRRGGRIRRSAHFFDKKSAAWMREQRAASEQATSRAASDEQRATATWLPISAEPVPRARHWSTHRRVQCSARNSARHRRGPIRSTPSGETAARSVGSGNTVARALSRG